MHPAPVSASWPSAPQAVIATVAVAKVEKLVNPPSTPLPQKNPGWKYPKRAEPTKLINSKGQISACGHAAAAVREPSPTLRPQRAKAPNTAPAPTMKIGRASCREREERWGGGGRAKRDTRGERRR